ncbi:SPOSA6832_01797, partial [Sporobolomyces salmonicolor]
MHRFTSPLVVLALIALIPSPSSALPLAADPALNLDITSGSWKHPLSGAAPPRLVQRDLGTAEIVVLLNGTVEVHTYVNAQGDEGEEEAVFNPAGRTGSKTKVVKNPKVVLNPKNPDYSSSAAARAPTTTTTTTTMTTSPTGDNFDADPTLTPASSSSTPSPAPATTTTASTPPSSSAETATYTGQATFFYQNGVAGACGNVNSDDTPIVALDARLYGNTNAVSKYWSVCSLSLSLARARASVLRSNTHPGMTSHVCVHSGRSLTITNSATGAAVVATVADACPTCASEYSLDLSTGAFDQIGRAATGVLDVSWSWNDE